MSAKPQRKSSSTAGASKSRKPATKTSSAPKKPGKIQAANDGAQRIDARIKSLGDWRGETLSRMRRLIHEADPDIVEECKWVKPSNPMGVPVWSHGGMVCTGETYKEVVKLTFARGASLRDPKGLFNSSLDAGTRRAIDIREGELPDAEAFKALVRAAVAENLGER